MKRNFAPRLHHMLILAGCVALAPMMASNAWADDAAGKPASADSTSESEFAKGAVYLEADEIFEDKANHRYVARGQVEARYENRILRADEVVYFPDQDKVHAKGNVMVVEADGSVEFAKEVELTDDLATGVALGFFARMQNGAVIGSESAAHSKDGKRNTLSKAFYTACKACMHDDGTAGKPTWRLRARKAVQDHEDQMIYYRDAVFEIKGIPILYSPFFAHADPTAGRHSGLLFPNLGYSGKYGFYYEQPYYHVISPSSDLTVSPRVFTDVNPMLLAHYRKQFYSGAVQFDGGLTYEQTFDASGTKSGDDEFRGFIAGQGRFKLSSDWYWGFGAEYAYDDLLFRRYDLSQPTSSGLFTDSSQRLSNQLFVVGQGKDYFASIAGVRYQSLRGENEDTFPLALPLVDVTRVLSHNFAGGKVTAGLNSAVLTRTTGLDTRRVSTSLKWDARFVSNQGIVASPFLRGRTDFYNITNSQFVSSLGSDNESRARALGMAGLDLRWPFLKAGQNVNWIIEPIVHLTASPESDGAGSFDQVVYDTLGNPYTISSPIIPNQDSVVSDFDESFLFQDSRFTGFDAWDTGLHAGIGGRIAARWGEAGYAALTAGRMYSSVLNNNFQAASSLQYKESDYVAGFQFSTGKTYQFSTSARFDRDDLSVRRVDAFLSTSLTQEDLGALGKVLYSFDGSVGYSRANVSQFGGQDSSQLSLRAAPFVTRNWGMIFAMNQDFEKDRLNSLQAGLVYDDDCSRFQIMFEHRDDSTAASALTGGDSIRFQFTLLTLGTFGN